ncbi:TolAlike protein [Acanthamoeba castellanii str. Neff]|uniref:TolAlike protein n=1 Tax=Acanthamoeba castellanii (strain ATCC 30010 / Neff) TaxID=1257118 RepID=L8GVG0_ACACF|nr:TolAlike protein [Acanthamoeba castellanii str. Neff]ELR16061.1 TolAlike protein [Acanthamoeba castellanii str. Neff]
MQTLPGANDKEKLDSLTALNHKEQAVWFLNAFWNSVGEANAEQVWSFKQKFDELDSEKRAEGSTLDEMQAHRFLETIKETLTVQAMREKLRSTGAIAGQIRRVPLTHYLIMKYNVDWHDLVNAVLGDMEEIRKAQQKLDEVQAALREAEQREQESKQAKRELDAALKDVKDQEDARNNKTAELQKKSEEGGLVSRNRAKAELAQHLAEDPLPLRKAKITLEAAVKKADKAAIAAEAAVEEARVKFDEAQAYLEKVKKGGSPKGALWWMERELLEARAYLPKSKGGYNKREGAAQ